MDVLVLYASSEGQTLKVAEKATTVLRSRGHDVEAVDAVANGAVRLSDFDAVILASRVHAGRHHPAIVSFARTNRMELEEMLNAFLSVSMSAAMHTPKDQQQLEQYRHHFVQATGWLPQRYVDVAGARLYTRHNRFTRWILGMVDGHRYDTSKDHEFTDWGKLVAFLNEWIGNAEAQYGAGFSGAQPTPANTNTAAEVTP